MPRFSDAEHDKARDRFARAEDRWKACGRRQVSDDELETAKKLKDATQQWNLKGVSFCACDHPFRCVFGRRLRKA